MKNLFKHKLFLYGVLISLLFAIEWYVPYRAGVVSFLLYMITPLRILLCLYMRSYFDTRVRQGEKWFSEYQKLFTVIAVVYLLDLLLNLLLTIPFPKSGHKTIYIVFLCITYFEFFLNAFVYLEYVLLLGKDFKFAKGIWLFTHLVMTIIFIYLFSASFTCHYIDENWYKVLVLMFLIREPLKLRIGYEEPKKIYDTGDLS